MSRQTLNTEFPGAVVTRTSAYGTQRACIIPTRRQTAPNGHQTARTDGPASPCGAYVHLQEDGSLVCLNGHTSSERYEGREFPRD